MAYTSINKPTDYFNTKLYTGNGSTQSITGVGFQPDWVWQKTRNYDYSHTLADVVRGASLNMFTNNDLADQTVSNGLTSFDSDGFSVGADLGWNASASDRNSKVAWNWLASNTTASNTDGSITSTVSVNTTSGFSIVSYTGNATTGATIGHGLGVTPDVIIAKSRASADNWGFFHSSFSSQDYMFLNTTAAKASASSVWNALPGSSVFTVGDNASVNDNGNMIAYCFAGKKGFSKFGTYTGNGSTNGTFVYTGFKPAFLIVKRYDSTNNWYMYNNKVNPFNETNRPLKADTSEDEATIFGGNELDFLSNGFKLKDTINGANGSGATYIYLAFAESPFTTSTGVPTTAR